MKKAKGQRIHAARRSAERCGLVMTPEAHRDLLDQIRSQKGEFVRRQSNRVSVWRLEYGDGKVLAVYDKMRKTIVTVIPDAGSAP